MSRSAPPSNVLYPDYDRPVSMPCTPQATVAREAAVSPVSPERLAAFEELLGERVFTLRELPHFSLLLRDLRRLGESLPDGAVVVALERTLLYGGVSLFAPFFSRQAYVSVDCSPAGSEARGAYNAHMLDDPRAIKVPFTRRASIEATGVDPESAELVIVPNLVHHVRDQDAMFAEFARIVRPGGAVYVFEPTVRELHQIPDDYLRYTPYGIAERMRKVGLDTDPARLEGGPFSAIAYCWIQALQYVPEAERGRMEEWFRTTHLDDLMRWDTTYRENLVRPFTKFPMSFSVTGRKRPARGAPPASDG